MRQIQMTNKHDYKKQYVFSFEIDERIRERGFEPEDIKFAGEINKFLKKSENRESWHKTCAENAKKQKWPKEAMRKEVQKYMN